MNNKGFYLEQRQGYNIFSKTKYNPYDNCIIVLGNFDGVHTAHRKLIEKAFELKNKSGTKKIGIWSFKINPLELLTGIKHPYILSEEQKTQILLDCGIDFVVSADFSFFKDMDANYFLNDVLKNKLSCIGAVCGYNHIFGKGGQGNSKTIVQFFGEYMCEIVPEIKIDNITVSSSAIREYITRGDMENAKKMMTIPYFLIAPVVKGKMLGRTIGFPTANQIFENGRIIPRFGIYASVCTLENGEKLIGVSNIGIRPTITQNDRHDVNCETYIHGFDRDIYGTKIKTEFYKLLRFEQKFSNLDELKSAINQDSKNSIEYFKNIGFIV